MSECVVTLYLIVVVFARNYKLKLQCLYLKWGAQGGGNLGVMGAGSGRRGGGRRDIQGGREPGKMAKISQPRHNLSQ